MYFSTDKSYRRCFFWPRWVVHIYYHLPVRCRCIILCIVKCAGTHIFNDRASRRTIFKLAGLIWAVRTRTCILYASRYVICLCTIASIFFTVAMCHLDVRFVCMRVSRLLNVGNYVGTYLYTRWCLVDVETSSSGM